MGVNKLMELQSRQTEAIVSLTKALTRDLPEGLRTYLEPEFDHLNDTIDSFSRMATRNQMDQLERVVESFISEMNRSMGNSFSELSKVVNQTLYVQEGNERQLREIYEKNAVAAESMVKTAAEMEKVSRQLEEISGSVSKYIKEVRTLEAQIAAFNSK